MKTKALALLCLVDFMVILDSQIVILGIPPVQRDLGFSADGVQWVLSAYLISFGGLLLLGGRAGDLLGRRRMLMLGCALFGASSLLCGLAWTPAALVAGRVLQGVSAAVMAPTALAILMTTFAEGPERNRAIAFWGATGGLGATAALLVGGTLVDLLGWRSIFLINVPIAALLLIAGPGLLQESRDRDEPRQYDLAGALTITLALASLIYAVVEVPDAGWLNPLFLVAAALLAAFIRIEQTVANPLVPLRLFRSRTLVGGNTVSVLAGIAAWGQGLLVSLYAQDVLGYSAIEFGLGTSVMTAGTLVGSFTAQRLANRIGLFPIAAVEHGADGRRPAAPDRRRRRRQLLLGPLPRPAGVRPRARRGHGGGLDRRALRRPRARCRSGLGHEHGRVPDRRGARLGDRDQRGRRARRGQRDPRLHRGLRRRRAGDRRGRARGDDARDATAGSVPGMSNEYSIVSADDVKDHYEGTDVPGEFRRLTPDLGAEQVALTLIRVPPHSDFEQGTGHFHDEIEEVYLVTRGTITFRLGEDVHRVSAPSAVRVAAKTPRSHRNEGDEPVDMWAISKQLGRHDATKIDEFWDASPDAAQKRLASAGGFITASSCSALSGPIGSGVAAWGRRPSRTIPR